MSSIRRRVAVLAVLLLAGAGALPWPGRPVAAAPAQAQPPQTPAPQTPAPQTPAPQTPAQPAQPAPAGQPDAQPPPAPDGQPTFRAGINFVRVDVIVTDRNGIPLTDLTQADFELAEDGKPQSVETFRLVQINTAAPVESQRRLTTRADEEIAAQDEDARIVVFFLDDYHVRLGNSMASRKHLVEFVQTQLGPRDLVAVMYPLSPLDSVTLTRDHDQLVHALERFQGRKFDYTPRNALEDRYANYPTEVVERVRRQVSLSALQGLSVKLGSLREGRKAIVLVSEGYVAMLPPQMRGATATMPGLGNPARNNPFAGETMAEDRAKFMGELDVQGELQRVFDAANRSNTAIYAVDPRGLSTGEFDIQDNIGMRTSQDALRQTQNTLRTLADETDGRAIVNRNDLAKGMQQLVRDSSAYYLIGYNSTQSPSDGKFHEIRVRVKRPGTQVRARKGYWALTATETARATAPPKPGPPPAVAKSLAGISGGLDRRLIRTWVGTAPADGGKAQVTFVWEAIPPPPGSARAPVGRVMLTALNAAGEPVFRGAVGEAAADGPPLRGGAAIIDAPPGKLTLRMSIEGRPDDVLDTEDRAVEVPDFTEPKARLTTPRVYVARNAREFQAIRSDPAMPPSATREFRRTERLLLRLDAVAPGGAAAVTYTARLLNRQGDKMADLPVTVAAGAEGGTIDFPLSSLPAGEFLIEIAAKAGDGEDVKELVAFRMVG